MQPRTANITRVWRSCDEEMKASGMRWYAEAHALALELDPDPIRGAAVIAVLSPLMSWPQNVSRAREAYQLAGRRGMTIERMAVQLPCLDANARKAARLLIGREDPTAVVGGRKVTAFWRLIADPWAAMAVCVDRHAFDIAVGRVTDDKTRGALGSAKGYEAVAEKYRRAAVILGKEEERTILPHHVQATCWSWWRVNRAVANHGEVSA